MERIGVIPARLASTRLPEKILREIAGKPMIQHVWERASKSECLDTVLVACDDERIRKCVKDFGATAVMTSPDHPSGTDRIAEAVKDLDVNVVVNIQGDEPLVDPAMIDELVGVIESEESCTMATLAHAIDDDDEILDPSVVKIVLDQKGYALYFSRAAIPFNRAGEQIQYHKHIGMYAYRKSFLMQFVQLPQTQLEKVEKLEQLRVLESGFEIKVGVTELDSVGVDTEKDLEKVEQMIKGGV